MNDQEFITRKVEHIRLSLVPESEAAAANTLDRYRLIHDSLPDLALSQVSISAVFLGKHQRTPFFIAGMTAGHPDAEVLNRRLAAAAAKRGWGFGLGSQRRELEGSFLDTPVPAIRSAHPELPLISNLGIAQLIEVDRRAEWVRLRDLLLRSGSNAIAIHLNPLQECIQAEGTPDFKGGLRAIANLLEQIAVPVILKETGSGMSGAFLKRIASLPIHAVDVSGLGGTHWGRIEGLRAKEGSLARALGNTFSCWGIPTAESIRTAAGVLGTRGVKIWASGGIRSGLDAAKCLALGASAAGFARPALEAAFAGEAALEHWMERMEQELRVALFCTNSAGVPELGPEKIERQAQHEQRTV
jgi:isopentenyl-diphosphate delta-isomerase